MPTDSPVGGRSLPHAAVFTVYVALAITLTWPLAASMHTHVPNDPGDPLLNTWLLWWNATHVPLTPSWWQAPAFYPAPDALTFSEHLAGLWPLSTPVQWVGGSPLFAYNVVLLLSIPLSGIGAYLLAFELTGRRDAAFLAGLIYAFAPYRIAQLAHLQVLASYAMPFALWALHRYIRGRGLGWLAAFGIAWLLQGLTNGYYLVFFTVLVGLWAAWFLPWRERRKAAAIAITGIIAALPFLPILLQYRESHAVYGFTRNIGEIRSFGADVTSLLNASPRLTFWSWLSIHHRPEGELFPGLGAVLLVVLGLWAARRHWTDLTPVSPRVRFGLAILVALFVGVAVSAWRSPWSVELVGQTISSSRPDKPLSTALVLLAVLVAVSRPMRAAFRTRAPMGFYTTAAVLTWLLALGPWPTLFDEPVLYEPPYAWLMRLPGFDTLRVPARFGMLMVLCLSAAAALGFRWLAPRTWPPLRRGALAGMFAIVIMADTWIDEMPLVPAPPIWNIAANDVEGGVLALPIGNHAQDVITMYQHMGHGKPLVNGFSGYFPPWYVPLAEGIAAGDPGILDELSRLGVTQVVTSRDTDRDRRWQDYAGTRAALVRRGGDDAYRLFDLPRAAPLPEPPVFSDSIPWAAITTNVTEDRLPLLNDGDLLTRWDSGPQSGFEFIWIDLGAPRQVAALGMNLGPYGSDFPRDLVVELSDDAVTWTEAWRGPTATMAFRAAVREVGRTPLTFDLGDRRTRYIRLRQVGSDETYYWSIAEMAVLAGRRSSGQ